MSTSLKGQRDRIQTVIENSVRFTGNQQFLILVNPQMGGDTGDVLQWTVIQPGHKDFGNTVADRIQRGFLPVGILDVRAKENLLFRHVVPAE